MVTAVFKNQTLRWRQSQSQLLHFHFTSFSLPSFTHLSLTQSNDEPPAETLRCHSLPIDSLFQASVTDNISKLIETPTPRLRVCHIHLQGPENGQIFWRTMNNTTAHKHRLRNSWLETTGTEDVFLHVITVRGTICSISPVSFNTLCKVDRKRNRILRETSCVLNRSQIPYLPMLSNMLQCTVRQSSCSTCLAKNLNSFMLENHSHFSG